MCVMYSAGNVSGIRLSSQAPPHASGKKEKRTPWGLCFFASQNMWSLVAPRFVCPPRPPENPGSTCRLCSPWRCRPPRQTSLLVSSERDADPRAPPSARRYTS
jgi:hypothetical protein